MWSGLEPASALLTAVVLLATACLAQTPHREWTCASCHTQAKTQPDTNMAHAMEDPAKNPDLTAHPHLTYQLGSYRYTVETDQKRSTYSVTDGKETITSPIHWIFGRESQTYVLEYRGRLFEGLVSFYPAINNLDITIGDQSIQPKTLEEAMGRLLTKHEVKACFGCHATNAVADRNLQLERITRGVTCEHCHANVSKHLEAISRSESPVIPPKLGRMTAEETSAFCGQCHRTWQTVVQNRWVGTMNVRFQPYRLAISKCFDGVDQRISCLACHDPHRKVAQNDKTYDPGCLACHSEAAKPSPGMIAAHPGRPVSELVMPVCPQAKDNCVSCHMPKVPLPGAHRMFTDHDIRIVKAGETYPH